MTTLNLLQINPVDTSETASAAVVTYPLTPVAANGVWYEQARLSWSDTEAKDLITVTGSILVNVNTDTTTTGQLSAVYARIRLFDETSNLETYAGVFTQQVYYNLGGTVFGLPRSIVNFNQTFSVRSGILTQGRSYSARIEVMKEQVTGTPNIQVNVPDATIYADSARVY